MASVAGVAWIRLLDLRGMHVGCSKWILIYRYLLHATSTVPWFLHMLQQSSFFSERYAHIQEPKGWESRFVGWILGPSGACFRSKQQKDLVFWIFNNFNRNKKGQWIQHTKQNGYQNNQVIRSLWTSFIFFNQVPKMPSPQKRNNVGRTNANTNHKKHLSWFAPRAYLTQVAKTNKQKWRPGLTWTLPLNQKHPARHGGGCLWIAWVLVEVGLHWKTRSLWGMKLKASFTTQVLVFDLVAGSDITCRSPVFRISTASLTFVIFSISAREWIW